MPIFTEGQVFTSAYNVYALLSRKHDHTVLLEVLWKKD